MTGAGGYIGTQLVRDLLNAGKQVTAVDRYFFGFEPIADMTSNKNLTVLQKDIRDLSVSDLKEHDAVCDLACLSNDPAGEIDPELTYQINRDGRIHVANTAKKAGHCQTPIGRVGCKNRMDGFHACLGTSKATCCLKRFASLAQS